MHFDRQRTERLALWLIVALGAALRVAELWAPLTHDELSAILRLRFDNIADLVHGGVMPDGHPAGMQVLLWLWSRVVGTSAPLLRLPFLLLGIGCIPLMYSVARRWYGGHAALWAATIMAFSQYTVYYSMPVRPYGTGLFFMLLLLHCWTRLFVERRWRWSAVAGFAVCAAACAYMHYFCALAAALLAVAGLFFVGRRELWRYAVACAAAVLLFVPHWGVTHHQLFDLKGVGGWLGVPEVSFFGRYVRYLTHHSWGVLLLVSVVWVLTFDPKVWRERRRLVVAALTLFVLPLLAGYVYSRQVSPVLQYSVLIFSYPFLLLALVGMVGERRMWRTDALVALCAAALLVTLFTVRRHYDVIRREYIPASVEMAATAQQRFGKENVGLLLDIHPSMLAYYDSAVAEHVCAFDEACCMDVDYVVTSRLSDEEMLAVRQRWPYLLDYRLCTGTKVCLLGRRPEGALPWHERVVKEGTVATDDEYTMLLDTVASALGGNRHVLVNSVVNGVDSNVTLVMETWLGDCMVDWHGADANDSVHLPLSLDLFVKSRLAFCRARVKVYLWRRGGRPDCKATYRIIAADGNPYLYSLLEEI